MQRFIAAVRLTAMVLVLAGLSAAQSEVGPPLVVQTGDVFVAIGTPSSEGQVQWYRNAVLLTTLHTGQTNTNAAGMAFVGFDRQGGAGDSRQVKMVMSMLEAGFATNLLFSSDFSAGGAQLKHNGGAGYGKTLTVFVPKLREAGVDEKTLHGILVDNPRRLLAFVPKR